MIKKVKNTVLWRYAISDFNGEGSVGMFYKKKLEKTNQIEFRIEKVIMRKNDKLDNKWRGYDNSFNS